MTLFRGVFNPQHRWLAALQYLGVAGSIEEKGFHV